MTIVLLALGAGFFFGASAVAIRLGFLRAPTTDPDVASLCLVVSGLAVVTIVCVAAWPAISFSELWPYLLLGVVSPAASALLWVRAVKHAGAARASLFLGTTPLWAVVIAMTALGESFEVPLTLGCLLIVLGPAVMYCEQVRPSDFAWVGVYFALGAALLFALRDNGARLASEEVASASLAAAAATLLGGSLALGVFVVAARRASSRVTTLRLTPAFVLGGVGHGVATALLYQALTRGRITVVEPLTSTSALWGVTIAAVVLRQHEMIGLRLFAAVACVVTGGAVIGVYR